MNETGLTNPAGLWVKFVVPPSGGAAPPEGGTRNFVKEACPDWETLTDFYLDRLDDYLWVQQNDPDIRNSASFFAHADLFPLTP